MSVRPRSVLSGVGASLAGVLILAACGSDAATVSQSQVEAKLKKDSQVKSLLDQLSSTQSNAVVSCIAKALEKDADGGDLDDYVHGNGSLDDIGGKDSKSKDKAMAEVESCVKNAVGSG